MKRLRGLALAWACVAGATAARAEFLVVREAPPAGLVDEIAQRPEIAVRWAERGLLVCEVERVADWPAHAGGIFVGERARGEALGIVRPPFTLPGKATREHAAFLAGARRATVRATAGPVWVLVAPEGSWPEDLVGCHGAVTLAAARVDPRGILDAPPPRGLAAWLAPRPLTAAEQRVAAAVDADSLARGLDLLTRDPFDGPADRWVFNSQRNGPPDLETIYAPRVVAAMQRAVAGIPGAVVERQPFAMRQTMAFTDTTHNLVARIPGSVPGTGTFVVCAHLDATGSRNAAWRADVAAQRRVQTPGAEDNASGIACMLEMLRVVGDAVRAGSIDFAFDLECIAFSGEEVSGLEQGLVGSTRYVERQVAAGTPLLGTLNFDMVGYDSLGTNLQVVHNPASTWLADLVVDAARGLVPPPALVLRKELDESRASDHNSFWSGGGAAILAADAPVTILREYGTYHRPNDLPAAVRIPRLVEVSRALLAPLLQLDTRAHTAPRLLFTGDDLTLRLVVQGVEVNYDRRFHRLWPGSPLRAQVFVHSLGATFQDSLAVELAVVRGASRRVIESRQRVESLPTGARVALVDPVDIAIADGGLQFLEARVAYRDAGGALVVQSARDSFVVETQVGLRAAIQPNPVRDPAAASLVLDLNRPGTLDVEVFNLEGERVASSTRAVQPRITSTKLELPLVQSAPGLGQLASGAYFARLRWRGAGGETADARVPFAIAR